MLPYTVQAVNRRDLAFKWKKFDELASKTFFWKMFSRSAAIKQPSSVVLLHTEMRGKWQCNNILKTKSLPYAGQKEGKWLLKLRLMP